ncbi:hypothetical protein E2542_SST03572 [Spatholobus suberectus]|nr:hypothetical protein E2542_SST03572 [Spatholobus suberectus]
MADLPYMGPDKFSIFDAHDTVNLTIEDEGVNVHVDNVDGADDVPVNGQDEVFISDDDSTFNVVESFIG